VNLIYQYYCFIIQRCGYFFFIRLFLEYCCPSRQLSIILNIKLENLDDLDGWKAICPYANPCLQQTTYLQKLILITRYFFMLEGIIYRQFKLFEKHPSNYQYRFTHKLLVNYSENV
jgi:hypothetical protein